jgi:hypothetical protein
MRAEYEKYMKTVVDKFASMCNMKELYYIWMNEQLANSDARISFYPCGPKILFDLTLAGEFDKKNIRDKFAENQKKALVWLNQNVMTYEEYQLKFDSLKNIL